MVTLDGFSSTFGQVCPVCKSDNDVKTTLMPIKAGEDVGVMQIQVHYECLHLLIKMNKYDYDIVKDVIRKGLIAENIG